MKVMSEERIREIKICIPEDLFSLVVPEKALNHILKAKKELLLSLRSLIDAKIEALEKKEEKKVEKKKKVKIE